MGIKGRAVRTAYGPRWYRSKAEARWAAFFTALGIPFHYEPTKFDLGYCRYVPDFYLPGRGTWIEVKAGIYGDDSLEKVRRIAEITEQRAFLFTDGWFAEPSGNKHGYGFTWLSSGLLFAENLFTWGECPQCGSLDICALGRAEEMRCRCFPKVPNEVTYADESNRLLLAYAHVASLFKGDSTTTKLQIPGTVGVSSSSSARAITEGGARRAH